MTRINAGRAFDSLDNCFTSQAHQWDPGGQTMTFDGCV